MCLIELIEVDFAGEKVVEFIINAAGLNRFVILLLLLVLLLLALLVVLVVLAEFPLEPTDEIEATSLNV